MYELLKWRIETVYLIIKFQTVTLKDNINAQFTFLMCVGECIVVITEEYELTRCCFLFYYTYGMLNMFQAILCPSSGAHDYSADYNIGRSILGLLLVGSWVQAGWISVQAAGYSLHQTSNQQQHKNRTAYVVISTIVVSS